MPNFKAEAAQRHRGFRRRPRSASAEYVDIAVVGAGQAGLSLSHELSQVGVNHVVLERGRVGQTWRRRWESFCLVIPNWTVQLPGGHYNADDPDGFMKRDDIVSELARYARSFNAPLREGTDVFWLGSGGEGEFFLCTSAGDILARQVVLASGAYQRPYRPPAARQLPESLHVINADDYTMPAALPPGKVLVVGSGQTGCQLAEELAEWGRDVFMACGRAPWIPRRIEGRHTIAWLAETSYYDATLADLPSPLARLGANPQASGRGGGHDLTYRTLQAMGVNLLGHLAGVTDGTAHFADDLTETVAFGDARYAQLRELIAASCVRFGRRMPEMPPPPRFRAGQVRPQDLGEFGAVVFASGYRPDYKSWVSFPEAFDDLGFPIQENGTSTIISGLHFMGVPFQRKRKSATLLGVAEDAAVLAETIAAPRRSRSAAVRGLGGLQYGVPGAGG
jgi:putative flavoprotein involved in K+ transport